MGSGIFHRVRTRKVLTAMTAVRDDTTSAERNVGFADRQDHDERRQDEGCSHNRGPQNPARTKPRYMASWRRQRSRGQLGECRTLQIVLLVDPFPRLDQVALHEADQRDRAAETDTA